jgi:23S rRNA (cytidine1920-2'-O)/16S rRNA (cytidine1409-2'-O)-methyltransferase
VRLPGAWLPIQATERRHHVARKARRRLRRLQDELARAHPHIVDPADAIRRGEITVDRRVVTNPASLVAAASSIAVRGERRLRGEAKFRAALAAFDVPVAGLAALDVGAAAGGFTRVLLGAGARRVYAVDAGHGQLLGSLRQDARVVNLERTNLGSLTRELVPEEIEVVTIDVSYLALAAAVPQLARVKLAETADAIALVKPQFELGLARPPEDPKLLRDAIARAGAAFETEGWRLLAVAPSPRGARGAYEYLIHARRYDRLECPSPRPRPTSPT